MYYFARQQSPRSRFERPHKSFNDGDGSLVMILEIGQSCVPARRAALSTLPSESDPAYYTAPPHARHPSRHAHPTNYLGTPFSAPACTTSAAYLACALLRVPAERALLSLADNASQPRARNKVVTTSSSRAPATHASPIPAHHTHGARAHTRIHNSTLACRGCATARHP